MPKDKERRRRRRERRERRERRKLRKQQEIVLTPEQIFTRLVALKNATRCILEIEEEYKIYVRLTKDFADLGQKAEEEPFEGSDQCAALSEECRRKAEKLKAKLPEHKEEISRTVTTTMREKEKKAGKKRGKGKWVALALLLLIIVAGICYKASPTRYLIAGIENHLSLKKYAMESYHCLGNYKDSKDKKWETMYEYAIMLQEDEQWEAAWGFFHRLAKKEYKDSVIRVLAVEKQIIARAEPGSLIHFGNSDWILMDKQGGKAMLARDSTIQGKHTEDEPIPGELYEDIEKKVTWEFSSLRAYLNGDFIQEEFSDEEQKEIQDTRLENADNKIYGTEGGKDTVDKVFILSADEIEKYADVLGSKAKRLRLRNPGVAQDSNAFFSDLKEVVYYGFPVNQKGVYNRPVLWVSYEE